MVSVIHNDRIIFNVAKLIRVNVPDVKRCANVLSNICHKVWCEVFFQTSDEAPSNKTPPFFGFKTLKFAFNVENIYFLLLFLLFFLGGGGGFGVSSSTFSRIS